MKKLAVGCAVNPYDAGVCLCLLGYAKEGLTNR